MQIIQKMDSVLVFPGGSKVYRVLATFQKSGQCFVTTEFNHVFRVLACQRGVAQSGFYFKLDSQTAGADKTSAVLELMADLQEWLGPYKEEG